jgi:hypothetical protein
MSAAAARLLHPDRQWKERQPYVEGGKRIAVSEGEDALMH